jgi:hypothetical protein
MAKATLHKIQVPTNRDSAYEAGVAAGEECRRRKGKPSILLRVALNDDYSAGFRAGFFQRALGKPRIANTAG